jgi:hypothetical protein
MRMRFVAGHGSSDTWGLVASGLVQFRDSDFRHLCRVASALTVEERMERFAESGELCPVCAHPRAADIDAALRRGEDPRNSVPGLLPSAAAQQRHLAEEHDPSRPAGWWRSVVAQLADRGVSLDNRRTWRRLRKVPGCPVCASPKRAAIEDELGHHRALIALQGRYGVQRHQLREHRRHM